jgi:excinuclease ABC subunit A
LEQLRDGNSVIVVEHDKDMIERADYVIDIGPKAGKFGGEIIKWNSCRNLKSNTITTVFEWRDENRSSVKKTRQRKIHETNWSKRNLKCFYRTTMVK